jgi:hypothetical protein
VSSPETRKSVLLLTSFANVATAATVTNHGLVVGQIVYIFGADQGAYNGRHEVTTVADSNCDGLGCTQAESEAPRLHLPLTSAPALAPRWVPRERRLGPLRESEKTGSAKRKTSRVKDLAPKGRKSGAVSGGMFNSFMPSTEFPTEAIRPACVADASPRIG